MIKKETEAIDIFADVKEALYGKVSIVGKLLLLIGRNHRPTHGYDFPSGHRHILTYSRLPFNGWQLE